MLKLSEEIKNQIVSDYLTTTQSVPKICTKYNIKIKDFFELKREKKFNWIKKSKLKSKCNENFFSDLNTEKPSYWGGFILGDGHLNATILKISLASKDLNHLEKFKNDIGANHKIYDYVVRLNDKDFTGNTLIIRKSKIINDLTRNGITQDKSEECSIPKTIPENMLHHFMRGVFDADGCFYTNGKECRFSVVSSVKSFCEEYQEILVKNCDLNKTNITSNKRGTCFAVTYSGNIQVKRIMDYLYKDATVYLERKYQKFQQHYANL